MAYKHTQEPALDVCAITVRPKLELKYKILVLTKYEKPVAKAIQAICEDAVKDVVLTKKELDAIEKDMKEAYEKRMANRVKIAAQNRSTRSECFEKRGR